jgi:GDSL-like Lipase/Acylhydrolase family
MRIMKQILCTALSFSLLFAGGFGCSTKTGKLVTELKQYDEKIAENNKKACISGCLIFEGDSNVELIDVQEYFSQPACNYARRGSTTEDLLKRVEKVKQTQPSIVVMLVGGNDLLRSVPVGEIEKNYTELLGYYTAITKNVFCISNLPVIEKLHSTNAEIITINRILERVCLKKGVTFVNIYPRLYKNGGLNPDYARDPVHLNKAGQDELVGYLKKFLNYR